MTNNKMLETTWFLSLLLINLIIILTSLTGSSVKRGLNPLAIIFFRKNISQNLMDTASLTLILIFFALTLLFSYSYQFKQ